MDGEQMDVEVEAKQLGWVPLEAFRGNPEKWVPAEEFSRRGKEILPILRKNNERLHADVSSLGGQVTNLQAALRESQQSIVDLVSHQTESTKRAVENARKDLRDQLKEARRSGDADAEFALEDRIQELDVALAAPKEEPKPQAPATVVQPASDPELQAWIRDNPFFGQDLKKTALVQAAAQELRNNRSNDGLKGRAFYDAALADVDSYLKPAGRVDGKAEGSSGGNRGTGPRVRNFSDLPVDAREACTAQAKRLVGQNKAFKDEKSWQKHYVEQYFLGES